MREINKIIIHCSATKENHEYSAKDIDSWHKANGWDGIGYHFVIKLDGTVEKGRDIDKVGAHCEGHNKDSIGICYIGGLDENDKGKDTRTEAQKEALIKLVAELIEDYKLSKNAVYGHNEFTDKKDCPCFDVKKEFRNDVI